MALRLLCTRLAVPSFAAPFARSLAAVHFKVRSEDGKTISDVTGQTGQTVLEACQAANVPLGGVCGGNMAYDANHMALLNKIEDEEQDMLDRISIKSEKSRLGCSIKITEKLEGVQFSHKGNPKKKKADVSQPTKPPAKKQPKPVTAAPPPAAASPAVSTPILSDAIWVGALDYNVRDFHGYRTPSGTSYNAYLLKDDSGDVLIDTVKYPFSSQLLASLSANNANLSHIIVNHAEMDHSSSLPAVVAKYPNAEILCSKPCADILSSYYNTNGWKINLVKDGETRDIAGRRLTFISTPLAHWPDSIMTYHAAKKTLFSMDAFGQHIASGGRSDLDKDVPLDVVMNDAKIYWANILNPLHKPVAKALAKVNGLQVDWILPAHGRAWNKHVPEIVKAYGKWCQGVAEKKVLVLYDTMWGSTRLLAEAIAEGATSAFRDNKVDGRVMVMCTHEGTHHNTDIVTEMMDSAAIALGSPILNGRMMPELSSALTYAGGLATGRAAKIGMSFGCYGWMGDKVTKELSDVLSSWGVKDQLSSITSFHKPDAAILASCKVAGRELASRVLNSK